MPPRKKRSTPAVSVEKRGKKRSLTPANQDVDAGQQTAQKEQAQDGEHGNVDQYSIMLSAIASGLEEMDAVNDGMRAAVLDVLTDVNKDRPTSKFAIEISAEVVKLACIKHRMPLLVDLDWLHFVLRACDDDEMQGTSVTVMDILGYIFRCKPSIDHSDCNDQYAGVLHALCRREQKEGEVDVQVDSKSLEMIITEISHLFVRYGDDVDVANSYFGSLSILMTRQWPQDTDIVEIFERVCHEVDRLLINMMYAMQSMTTVPEFNRYSLFLALSSIVGSLSPSEEFVGIILSSNYLKLADDLSYIDSKGLAMMLCNVRRYLVKFVTEAEHGCVDLLQPLSNILEHLLNVTKPGDVEPLYEGLQNATACINHCTELCPSEAIKLKMHKMCIDIIGECVDSYDDATLKFMVKPYDDCALIHVVETLTSMIQVDKKSVKSKVLKPHLTKLKELIASHCQSGQDGLGELTEAIDALIEIA